jgi:hypothetical protein
MHSSPHSSPASSAALPPETPSGHHRAPPAFEDVRRILVMGLAGCGKSNLTRAISAPSSRLLQVDPHREYTDLAVEINSLDALDEYLGRARGDRFRIAYVNDHLEEDFPVLCDWAYRAGHLTLGVEETGEFCTPHRIPRPFYRLAMYGRHPHVSYIVCTRSPAWEIHHVLTSQSWELFCFRMTEPEHLEFVRKFCGREFAERVAQLPPMRCLWRNLYDGTEPTQEFTPPDSKQI